MPDNILWLASWYPTPLSPLDGDFIQRHARAASLLNNITVIFIKKDDNRNITKNIKKETTRTGNLTEIIIYYHPLKTGIRILDRLLSRSKYNRIYQDILKEYFNENNKPALVHVHVALNVARQALWLNKKYAIPIIVSEHWTGYLPEATPNLDNYNPLYKKWLYQIFNKASAVTVVSKVLGEALSKRFKNTYTIIPNVVDTTVFFPVEKIPTPLTDFIHVSLLNHQKNVSGIVEACSLVKDLGHNFQLTIYGPRNIELEQLVISKDLYEHIILKKEVPQAELAKDMQRSDALILYSRYETFGCVVIEANACGIPAILSDLPVFREYILENKTGIFAIPGEPRSLSAAMIQFIQHKNSFVKAEISEHTKSKFSFETVAQQFDTLYKGLIRPGSS